MIHIPGARGCLRTGMSRARVTTQGWYKQEKTEMCSGLQIPQCRSYLPGVWQNQSICGLGGEGTQTPDGRKGLLLLWFKKRRQDCHPNETTPFTVHMEQWIPWRRCLLGKLGRSSHNPEWQCECCTGRSCCAPQVTLIVRKGYPQEGVRKDNGFNL